MTEEQAGVGPPPGEWPQSGRSTAAYRLGFWAAALVTFWIIAFDLAAAAGALLKLPDVLVLAVAFMIVPPFVVLLAAVHHATAARDRVWSLTGLAFGLVYASILSLNYFLMLTVVRANPAAFPAMTMNFQPDSVFWALETIGYTFMSAAGLFLIPVFGLGRRQSVIRWAFFINAAATAVATAAYVATLEVEHPLVLLSLAVWGVAFPLATGLIAALFRRAARSA